MLTSSRIEKIKKVINILKILLVKLSSLGDIIHNLPIVWDIRKKYPDAQIDWIVDELYIELLKPLQSTKNFKGIDNIIPIGLRRWHKALKKGQINISWHEFKEFRYHLKQHIYDIIIETQGLIKSAVICRLAVISPHAKIIGLGNGLEYSGYESLAKKFYTKAVSIDKKENAIDCNRFLAAQACYYPTPHRVKSPPQFYPKKFSQNLNTLPNPLGLIRDTYVLCFHASAKITKCWDLDNWIKISLALSEKGLTLVYPWGNSNEKKVSEMLAYKIPNAIVPRAFTLSEAFVIISQAKLSIGVDTGLTHLSATLQKPTVELFIDSPKGKVEGYWHPQIYNLGDKNLPPTDNDVKIAIEKLL